MRRALGISVALLIAVLLASGCGVLDSGAEQIEDFSYSDSDDKSEFIAGCAEAAGGNEKLCKRVFACYEKHVPIEDFRELAADAIENGAEADMSGINKKAQACIVNAQALDPEALGGYADKATRASFVRECAKGAGIDGATKLCQEIYACLEEKVPFKDFFAYSQAEITGKVLDPRVKKRVEACATEVADSY